MKRGFTPVRWRYADEPRRCDTGAIGGMGECLHCSAEQGVACRCIQRTPRVVKAFGAVG